MSLLDLFRGRPVPRLRRCKLLNAARQQMLRKSGVRLRRTSGMKRLLR